MEDVSRDKAGADVALTVAESCGGCSAASRRPVDLAADDGAPHWNSGACLALVFPTLLSFLAEVKGEENGEVPNDEFDVAPKPDLE
jgi:hypothetical protein